MIAADAPSSPAPPPSLSPSEIPTGRRAFLVMFGVFALTLGGVVIVTMRAQGGQFTYALDDAAIHLTLARTLAHHGTFGLVPGAYESASSAPLWEFLVAPLLLVSGDSPFVPLALNVVAAGWVLWCFSRLEVIRRLSRDTIGVVAVGAIPIGLGLVPLVMSGMEHTLQVALTLAIVSMLMERVRDGARDRAYVPVYVLLAVATFVRFEFVFVAVGVAVALVVVSSGASMARRVRMGAIAVASTLIPVGAFAVVNRAFGQYSLPNSVVAKTALGDQSQSIVSIGDAIGRFTSDPVLVVFFVLAATMLVWRRTASGRFEATAVPAVVMLTATVVHVFLADVGWFERYQAYLIAGLGFGALALVPRADRASDRRRVGLILLALCVLRVPLLLNTPLATYNVYESEWQLGRFLAASYPSQGVGVNDVGYVSWLHDGDIVDFVGLASYDMLKARKEHAMSPASTAAIADAHGVRVIAVHDEFFGSVIPPGWAAAGQWCLTNRRLAVSSPCVTFYAPAGAERDRLRAALEAYASSLPPEVEASYR